MNSEINNISWWDDAIVGDKRTTLARTVTEADLCTFCGLSGTYEPIHCDAEYAKTTIYGQRIVNGLLSVVIADGLRGSVVWYNGDNFRHKSVIGFLGMNNLKFPNPLFIGDTIHVVTTIASKKETSKPGRGIITFLDEVVKQDGTIVAQWERVTMYKMRPQE